MAISVIELLNKLASKRLILDFDGVATHLVMDWDKMYQELNKRFSVNLGRHWDWWLIYVKLNHLESKFNELVAKYELVNLDLTEPSPLIIQLKKINRHFCLCSNNVGVVNKWVEKWQLRTLVDQIVTANDVMYLKPHPEGINKIIGKTNSQDWVMVGDAMVDELAAKLAGICFEYYEYR